MMEYCNLHKCPATQELCNECLPHTLNTEPDMIDSFGRCGYNDVYEGESLQNKLNEELYNTPENG